MNQTPHRGRLTTDLPVLKTCGLPPLGLTTPMVVQLKNSAKQCRSATYSAPIINASDQFKAKSD